MEGLIQSGINKIKKYAVQTFNTANNFISQPYNAIGQQVSQYRASLPQNQQTGISAGVQALPQVARTVANNIYSQVPGLNQATQYLGNRMLAPALSVPSEGIQSYNAFKQGNTLGGIGHGVMGGLNALYTAGNVMNPVGTQLGGPGKAFLAWDTAKSMIQGARTKTDKIGFNSALEGFTGKNQVGLGNAISDNPNIANPINTIETAASLLYPAVAGIKGKLDANKLAALKAKYGPKYVESMPHEVPGNKFSTAESSFTFPDKAKVVNGKVKVGSEVNNIINDRIQKTDAALKQENPSLLQGIQKRWMNFKEKMVDSNAPITDLLGASETKNKLNILPTKDIRYQLPRVKAADVIGDEFATQNGLTDVIKTVDNPARLSEYLKAKHQLTGQTTAETGLNKADSQKIVGSLSSIYEPFAQKINQYTQKLLDYRVQSGLMSQETANMLKQKYPDYIPLNRIMSADELSQFKGNGSGIASISQTGLKGRVGSSRAIQDPLYSLLESTRATFRSGETNKAAQMLTSYKELPGNPFQLKPVKPGESPTHFITVFENGQKVKYATTPEVASVAKNLGKEQIGFIGKLLSYPVRLLKTGATGVLNPIFTVANYVNDQGTAFINSDKALSTSVANPVNFMKSMTALTGHGPEFQLMLDQGLHGGTTFDIYRDNPKLTIEGIRAGRNLLSQIKYKVTNPEQLLRAAEDIVGSTEKLTRMQQFIGTKDALIKAGRTEADATLLASKAYRENTVDFSKSGTWGKVLNQFIPYFNAGIQGSRTFVNTMRNRPVQTATKMTIAFFTPMALATAWNMSDPKRLQAYNDIQSWEKKNNFILVPPNPVKDDKGSWNTIKIPISQEVAYLTGMVRKMTEQLYGGDPIRANDLVSAISGTFTPYDITDPQNIESQMMPQITKPGTEILTNKNMFTGKDVVPKSLQGQPTDKQVYPWTSGTARKIGGVTGLSPITVENAVSTTAGTGGKILLNASDQILNKAGVIPSTQIGGTSIGQGFGRRFLSSSGGQTLDNVQAQTSKNLEPRVSAAYDMLHAPKSVDENGLPATNKQESMAFASIRLAHPEIVAKEAADARAKAQIDNKPINPFYDLPWDKQRTVLNYTSLPPGETKSALAKQNISWLKPYWESSQSWYAQSGQKQTTGPNAPQPSARAQSLMDAGNFKDPEVKAYLDANTAYKNAQLEALGLPALAGFKAWPKTPKKVAKVGKTTVKKVKAIKSAKVRAIKSPKLKVLKSKTYKVAKAKQIKVKMPKFG